MEWLNIHISTLRSPEFIGSNPTERATWLCVLGYSVEQENGGRIVSGATWKDRQWQQACGVTLREVKGAGKLLLTDGSDILVNGYPIAKEAHVRQARKVAHAGAMARWGGNAERYADNMPNGIANGNAEGKGREQEGKGREAAAPAPVDEYAQERKWLESLGAYTLKDGVDIITEWIAVTRRLKVAQVEEIFRSAVIQWPSEFKAARKARGI